MADGSDDGSGHMVLPQPRHLAAWVLLALARLGKVQWPHGLGHVAAYGFRMVPQHHDPRQPGREGARGSLTTLRGGEEREIAHLFSFLTMSSQRCCLLP